MIDTVFGEFTQINNPARDPAQGTGLGLATVQRLARLLDHPLAVRSRAGQGSSFELLVPGCPEPMHTSAPDRVDSNSSQIGAIPAWHILVVEDNILVREALRTMLISWGHECHHRRQRSRCHCSDGEIHLRCGDQRLAPAW